MMQRRSEDGQSQPKLQRDKPDYHVEGAGAMPVPIRMPPATSGPQRQHYSRRWLDSPLTLARRTVRARTRYAPRREMSLSGGSPSPACPGLHRPYRRVNNKNRCHLVNMEADLRLDGRDSRVRGSR